MTGIVEFLTVRLNEDQRIAEATSCRRWVVSDGNVYKASSNNPIAIGPWSSSLEEDGEHIAHYDPARMLAEVAAKRAILAEHFAAGDNPSGEMRDFGYEEGLGEAIRLLALVYANHPDFDPAWRV